MKKLDEMIEEALREEDAELLGQLQEAGYFSTAMTMFRSPQGWVAVVVMIMQSILFVIGLWCMIRFAGETEVLGAVKWGIAGATLILMATNLKLSLAPQMQAERVLREIRRLELMIASRK